jgi:membrane protein implicated in regulation of membrane protease activity
LEFGLRILDWKNKTADAGGKISSFTFPVNRKGGNMAPAMNLSLYLDLVLLSLLTVLLVVVSVHRTIRTQKRRDKERERIEKEIGAMQRANGAAASRFA